MATKRRAARASGSPRRKRASSTAIRYLFYSAFLLSIIFTGLFVYLYQINYLPLSAAAADSSITLSLIFPFAAIAYLLWRGNNPKSIIAKLGLKKKGLTVRTILLGILLFLAMLFTEMLLGLFQELTHIPLPTNVQALFAGLPLYFLVFAAFIAPFDEEVFFRGLLVPQIGIILSAFFFALLHYLSYLSISEFIVSFVFGLLAGYTFKRTDSIYPSIIAHVLVNSMAVITLLYSMLIIV